jgi:HlyD family secretion protein
MNVRRRRILLWSGLGVVLAVGLVFAFRPQPVPVDFARVTRGRLVVTVDEEGETRVRDVFVLSAPVAGRVRRIEAEVGDPVEAGKTVLAQIEPVDPDLLDVRSESEAQAAVRSAQAEVDFANKELKRQRELGQRGVASRRDLDAAERAYRTAQAALEEARAALEARNLAVAQARRPQQFKRGSKPDEQCACIPVRAPVSGRVLRVVRQSEGVVRPAEPLLEIGDPVDLEIVVDLLSADAVQVSPGQEVLIEQWGGGQTLHGRVRRVEPTGFTKVSALGIEEQRVNVILDLTDPPAEWGRLGHGYRVETRIVLWRGENVLKVPLSALFRTRNEGEDGNEAAGDWAVFVETGGRAHLRPVSRGHHNGLEVEILNGLSEGERVVLHPSDRVVDGVRVNARK